jgi:YegS/Rv2252/BmrU family lipid kinase
VKAAAVDERTPDARNDADASRRGAGPIVLVVNPAAGAGDARRKLAALARALDESGAHYEVHLTRRPGDATPLVRAALLAGAAGVGVMGGDGTLGEAAGGFFDEQGRAFATDRWLAPLPAGTGGDFRRTVGAPVRPTEMARALLAGKARPIDCGWVRYVDDDGAPAERAFLNIASFGMSGVVDRLVNAGPKWIGGRLSFLIGSARALLRYRPRPVVLQLDDAPPRRTTIVNLAVANGRFFGGGMMIAPTAEVDDGRFDVVGLEDMSLGQVLGLTGSIYRGGHVGRPGVSVARASKVVAEPLDPRGPPVLLDVDGEAPGRLPATFELRRAAFLLRT